MNPYLGSYELTPPEIAEQLIINGFSPCPLEPMSKAITIKNWTKKEFNPNQFTQMNGVGIRLVMVSLQLISISMIQKFRMK